jgi:hypothetical protein
MEGKEEVFVSSEGDQQPEFKRLSYKELMRLYEEKLKN